MTSLKKKKDPRIDMFPNSSNEIEPTLLSYFNEHGFMVINNFKCYSAGLAHLFSFTSEVKNLDTNEIIPFDRKAYKRTFSESFNKGVEYFTNNFKVSASTIYSKESKALISDLLNHYYHKEILGHIEGWNGIRGIYHEVFTHTTIENIGYYSGILSKADELIEMYPNAFEKEIDKFNGIDLTDTKDIDKVRYLIQMGIVDNLHNNGFTHSVNAMAIALGAVTGIKRETIEPYLRYYLTDKEHSKNIMNVPKSVKKVDDKLKELRFVKPKSNN
jgi:hypothetical protein